MNILGITGYFKTITANSSPKLVKIKWQLKCVLKR